MTTWNLFWLAGFLILPGLSQGQVLPSAGSALQFLNTEAGAKATALGGAYSAVADDPSAVYWNPAGISWFNRPEIQTTYNQWFLDTYFQDLVGVFPTPWGAFGGRLSYVNFGSFDLRDQSNNLQGSQTPQAWAGAFSAAIQVGSLGFGLSAKADQESFGNYSVSGLGLDAGVLFRREWGSLSLGVRNIGQAGVYSLPTEYYAGGAATLGPPNFFVRVSTDATLPQGYMVLHHGLEWGFGQVFFLRGGYQWSLQSQPAPDQAGFGGGVGIQLGAFQLDYSIVSNGDLGLTNKAAVSFAFEKPAPAKRPRQPVQAQPTPAPYVVASAPTPYPAAQAQPVAPPAPAESMRTLYRRGITEYQSGQLRLAAIDLRKAAALEDPSVPSYYYAEAFLILGVLYQYHAKFEGHLKTAEQYYRAALHKEPGNAAALKHLRELLK